MGSRGTAPISKIGEGRRRSAAYVKLSVYAVTGKGRRTPNGWRTSSRLDAVFAWRNVRRRGWRWMRQPNLRAADRPLGDGRGRHV